MTTELGAKNVIYYLLDDVNKLIYVGETGQDPKTRLSDKEHYKRQEFLTGHTIDLKSYLLALVQKLEKKLENMIIRAYATLFSNTKNVKSIKISDYKLINRKIKN